MNTSRKSWLIAEKDLRELLSNRMVVLPMTIVPVIVCVALPLALLVLGLKSGLLLMQGAEFIEGIVGEYPVPAEFATVPEQVLFVFLNYSMLGLYLIIPIMVSSIIAAHAVAGEKERGTLETLLYTPVTNREFFLGKLLSAFVPAMAIAILSFVLYFATANLAFLALRGIMIIRSWIWLPALLVLTPAVSLLGLGGTLLVSLRSKTFLQAQQSSAFIVLPCVMYLGTQMSGAIVINPLVVAALGGVLLAADWLIVARVGPRFERERIISSL